jgi:hypothetical protein
VVGGGVASEFTSSPEVFTNHVAHHIVSLLEWVNTKNSANTASGDDAYTRLEPLVTSLFHQ